MNQAKLLLVGLGNITHPNTRHNVGMMVLDQIAKHLDLSWAQNRNWKSDTTSTQIVVNLKKETKEYNVVFLKPRKLMNISGSCVAQAVKDLSIPLTNVYVFHDDMQRELGKVSLKASGSANGHNGIKSIIEHLKKDDFKRVRIGIGRPKMDDRSHDIVANFVLGKFSSSEIEKLQTSVYPLWTEDQGLELLCDRGQLKPPAKKKKTPKQAKKESDEE
ncbi:peptidyl-tRNA hydrolase-domain-containing protein [Sporodiniella umbellata]|nr:peptidyl-tRNA hydrolase-domain-containing protein [Sporodiniella umbellata]